MAEFIDIAGIGVGLERPEFLLAVPVVLVVLAVLLLRRSGGGTSRLSRLLWLGFRVLIVVLIVTAAAGPFTVTARETSGEPRVTMLVDESRSTEIAPSPGDALAEAIEEEGVPVSTRVVGSNNRSQIGDAVVDSARENGSLLLVSDGQVTGGRSLAEAAEFAQRLNTTVNAVSPSATESEASVRLNGPEQTSIGASNQFVATVDGVEIDDQSHQLTVTIDGEQVNRTTVEGEGSVAVPHTFQETGVHRITVRIEAEDRFDSNDVYYKTVRVVDRPDILYVSRQGYPLESLLDESYDLETADRVPSRSELDSYLAVVTQNMPPTRMGNLSALQQYVIDGNGLVVVGGPDAYENGDYEASRTSVMLPVRNGTQERTSRVMIVVDISGSAQAGLDTQKALALNVIDQLGDQNTVGLLAFNSQPFIVAEPRRLGESRADLERRVRQLQSGGRTRIAAGLIGAQQVLQQGGSVVLLSDGRDRGGGAVGAAEELGARGIRVISIGVGNNVNQDLLQRVARQSGGTYFTADQTNRLRLLFGGQSRQFEGGKLTIADSTHFITRGASLTASPGTTHDLAVKDGADLLVAGESGDPAVATWTFGLGRSASITAYDADGTLDGLLSNPDSLLVTRTVNWAIGDPDRDRTGVVDIETAAVGRPTTVTFVGDSRPDVTGVRFVRTDTDTFEGRTVPREAGYATILGTEYAVNYPRELSGFGPSRGLGRVIRATGGEQFEPGQAAAIARSVTEQHQRVRTIREDWGWALLTAALVLYLLEVVARRLRRVVASKRALSFSLR